MPLFERDRYQRLDGVGGGPGRKPSSFCSSATIIVFVALCLVGAWMMASSNNIPVNISPENKSDAEEKSVNVTESIKGGASGDTPQTTDEAVDAAKKDDDISGGGDTPQTKDRDDAGDTDNKVDGATQSTDDVSQSDAVGTNSTATAGGTVTEGETASKSNQTFSDENGKMEGGDVANPEDPDKKVEQNAEQSTEDNGGQADNKTTEEASTDDKADSSGQEAATTDSNDTSLTPTDGGTSKNQTTFDDVNGEVDGGGVAPVKDDASSDKEQATTDDDGTSSAARNETSGGQSETTSSLASADGANNGTVSQDTSTDEKKQKTWKNGDTGTEKPELLPSGQAELLNETASAVAENGTFPTQAKVSSEEKNKKKKKNKNKDKKDAGGETSKESSWKLCNVTAGADYIPCLDNVAAIKKLKSTKHYEHRERHCPADAPTCLVPLPEGYRQPIPWPHSRDKIWYHNVPHTKLASYKGHQNWVRVSGEHLTFPGGGTQFLNGAAHYIDLMQEAVPEVAWGNRSRVVLDVGCGVASFGGFLFDKDALTMSFAPKDEHEAQVQFALERGIPAVSAVMGTKRLPFPGNVYDVVHCARCRVPWHIDGGRLLLEVNRLLRPGGLFVWSATPVYRKVPEDVEIWHAMTALTKSMCWEMVKRTSDTVDQTAMVFFKKPTSNDCYDARAQQEPPMCEDSDDQNAAWNITLKACMHRVPTAAGARGSRWPEQWPNRLAATPYWLGDGQVGVYGKLAPADFAADQEHWRKVVQNSYLDGMGIDWKNVRNVMDMRAVYGGFAAALRDMNVWVMNVVTINSPDTLPIIYERGLFGMYHDWCESFSTYPRSYDLVHADHLFSKLKNRCNLVPVMVEVDRIMRPEGKLIVRDDKETVEEVLSLAKSLHWEVRMTVSRQGEELLCVSKTMWRPTEVETLS